jgi:hypothetical protein
MCVGAQKPGDPEFGNGITVEADAGDNPLINGAITAASNAIPITIEDIGFFGTFWAP